MPEDIPDNSGSIKAWGEITVRIVNAVTTVLGLLTVITIFVSAACVITILNTGGTNQLAAILGMLLFIVVMLFILGGLCIREGGVDALLLSIHSKEKVIREMEDFGRQIAGDWWDVIITTEDHSDDGKKKSVDLGFIKISYLNETHTVMIKGRAFSETGMEISVWESEKCCLIPAEKKILYSWKGYTQRKNSEKFSGFTVISFETDNHGRISNGTGNVVSNTDPLSGWTTIKNTEITRGDKEKDRVMNSDNGSLREERVREQYQIHKKADPITMTQ